MAILRIDDTIFLDGVCAVEDAEILLQQLQDGAAMVDWSGCTHLHAACFQLIQAARVPMSGTPANLELARWIAPILQPVEAPARGIAAAEPETLCVMET
jgi:hypothetical protein